MFERENRPCNEELKGVMANFENMTAREKFRAMAYRLSAGNVPEPQDFRPSYGIELERTLQAIDGLTDEQYERVAELMYFAFQAGTVKQLPPGYARKN